MAERDLESVSAGILLRMYKEARDIHGAAPAQWLRDGFAWGDYSAKDGIRRISLFLIQVIVDG